MDLLELPLVDEHSETSGEALYANKAKRALDVIGAFMALLLFAPLMALIFLIVKLDGGPAFFGHTRIGKDGRAFTCWKFRSVGADSEEVLEAEIGRASGREGGWKD